MGKCYGRQPDSGNPTVRDEKGGIRKRDLNKGSYKVSAPDFYPNHGYKNLSTVFAMLMMLAFLIDQTEQLCCGLFQGALKQSRSKKTYLWRTIRELFVTHVTRKVLVIEFCR